MTITMIRLIINNRCSLLLPPTTTTIGDRRQIQTQITKRLLSSTTTTPATPVIITSSSWKEIASSYFNSYSSSGGGTNNREEMVSSASTSTTSETLQSNNNNGKMKKRKQLAVMIESAVRKRLKKQFPNEFDNENSTTTSTSSSLSSLVSFQTLLTLNGYQRIVIPTGNNASRLYLAEGVVVTPRPQPLPTSSYYYSEFTKRFSNNRTMRPKERLYVQSQQQQQQQMKNQPVELQHELLQLPNFVQEDITLYRIIENSAAQFLDRRYISMTGFLDRRLIRPFTDVKYRTRIAIKTVHSMQQKFQHMVSPSEKSLIELLIEKISNSNNNKNNKRLAAKTTLPSTSPSSSSLDDTTNFRTISDDDVVIEPAMLVSSATTPPLSSLSLSLSNEEEREDKDPLETLMVISSRPSNDINNDNNDETILSATIYNYMTPSTRLLALGTKYYLLQHSSASTLVSCSIVIFGAIPLSYRSYLFSIQYSDLLSSTSSIMALSVVGTISYGILSSRWKAQTSQSYIISNALCERIYSRNESSYYLLQQNAIQYITKSIVNLYGNNGNENNIICYDSSSSSNNSSNSNNNNNNHNHNHNKDVLVNPIEWAIDFGLLMKQEQEHEQEQQYYYKAIPLEDALKCMKMNMNMNADS